MDLPDETDDVDLVLRHVSRLFPEQFARALLPREAVLGVTGWLDTQVTSRQRRLDRALDVTVDGERRILLGEWQVRMTADVPFRIYEYNVLTVLALADEIAAGPDPQARAVPAAPKLPPVESTLVLLSGREEPWPADGELRTSPPDRPFSGVRFRIEPVYQRTIAELAAKGSALWMIFVPLAVDASGEKIGEVLRQLRAQTTKREFEELAVAMTAIADWDKRGRCLREQIVAFLPKEVVVQSWIYKQGVEQGEARGIAKGEAKGEAGAVIKVLEARGIRVSKATRERILASTDAATLDRWLERAIKVKKATDIFEETAS
jgi:hypothetical protein